ncbi:MAG TPA: hypothetical protein PK047_06935 [Saprospiraceae bacterium]|jgi:hypothetical protein|nr:hypothetical protein [Saprospiraceae bacterium]
MIVRIDESDLVRVSFELDAEELGYYQEALLMVAQACLRSELSSRERNSLTLMLDVARELIGDRDVSLYHVYDIKG